MAVVCCKLEGLRKVYLTFIMLAMKEQNRRADAYS